jgi:hypothetical protein
MTKVREIKGTITLVDGSVSEFMIGIDGVWQQWGATRERLSESSEVMDALTLGLFDDGLMASSDDEDEPEEDEDEPAECPGHESTDGAHMGEAVYCDGSCQG